jgi:hypothetical protein
VKQGERDAPTFGAGGVPAATAVRLETSAFLVILAAVAAPGLLAVRPAFVEPAAAYLFVAAIWVGLLATYLYLRDPDRAPLPLLPLTAFFYIIFFALPPFLIAREWWSRGGTVDEPRGVVFESITTETAALVLVGLGMLVVGYHALRPLLRAVPYFRAPRDLSWLRLRIILWSFAAAHLLYLYLPAARGISSLAQAMAPIGLFTLGLLFIAWYRGHLRDSEKIVYWTILVPLEFLIHVYEGLITPIILLFLFLITLYWYVSHKAGVILTLVLCAALYIFPVLKLSNVFIVESSPSVASRVSDKMDAIGLAALLFSTSERDAESGSRKNVIPPLLRRLSLVVLLQYCVDQTPERVPYLEGATLNNLATNLVPRVFWPEKPTEVMGQWVGHTYGILEPADHITSINLPWLVEFYINFGIPGVILGMAAAGALLALLEGVLLRAAMTDVEIVSGWALLFRFFYQESNISLMLGGFLTQAVFFLGFIWIVVRFFARSPATSVTPP